MSTPPFSGQDEWARRVSPDDVEWARQFLGDAVKKRIDDIGFPLEEVARLGVPNLDDLQALCGRDTTSPAVASPRREATEVRHLNADAIVAMTATEKLFEAYDRACIRHAVGKELRAAISPEALAKSALIVEGFAAATLVAQLTPVGWIEDLILAAIVGVNTYFVGTAVITALEHLIEYAGAANATSDLQLTKAGDALAQACADIGVNVVTYLVGKKLGGGAGHPPKEGVLNDQVALAEHNGQLMLVAAKSIREYTATESGMTPSGPGGPPRGSGGGRGGGAEPPRFPDYVNDYVKRLRERYPKLKDARLRPAARSEGQAGAAMEAMLTGSSSRLTADWAERASGRIEFDDISPEGKIVDVKDRDTGREYRHEARERIDPADPPALDVVDHITRGSSAPRERPAYRLPKKDEIQLTEHVRFARTHDLTGVEWRTTSEEYAKLVQQVIDAHPDWKDFVTVEFMGR